MSDLSLAEQLEAKSVALELVALALLREKRGDVAFWSSLDKLTQVVLNLEGMRDPQVAARAELVQHLLDAWRQTAGDDQAGPAPSGSGPWSPSPE